ncbi:MAG: HD domain-containing phosphohydrolase [Zavarzinella sp.]
MIRLKGISGEAKGREWTSESLLRAGRISNLEIVLEDNSVSRQHAEVRRSNQTWWVRDLSSTNGTFVNGVRLGSGERELHQKDIVQFGKVAMVVELKDSKNEIIELPTQALPESILFEAEASSSWQDGVERLLMDRNRAPRPGDQLMALLRAGYHFTTCATEEELLKTVLNDAVSVLDAQRGAIILADGPGNELILKSVASDREGSQGRTTFSKHIAQKCYQEGRSILCTTVEEDEELSGSGSIVEGAMASVLSVLLRTPRTNLGVIHLDRNYWQRPFTVDDLYLADALASHVSAGIEAARFMRQQKDMFLQTVTAMANSIEMRDKYTGGHTARVTTYSLIIAEQMSLSEDDIEKIRIGGPLHDIGKIGIPDHILGKEGRLTDEERDIMNSHAAKGEEMLRSIPALDGVRPIVRSHHEKWDGTGYPDRLAGEGIPFLARLLAVADSFDAMTTKRPYNKKNIKTPEQGFEEVLKCAGTQFDPDCAKAFIAARDKIENAFHAAMEREGEQ